MATITLETQITPKELLQAVSQLSPPELEEFTQSFLKLQAQRRTAILPQDEAELLLKINQERPSEFQCRYEELMDKRRAATLTEEEYEELLRLTEQAEAWDVRKVEYLVELAKLRQTSLRALMEELGIGKARDA